MLQPAAQAPPDQIHCTLSLQESPSFSVLLNKVAAEVPNKWEILGLQLKIDLTMTSYSPYQYMGYYY